MNLIEFPYFLYVENQIAEQHRHNKFSKTALEKLVY